MLCRPYCLMALSTQRQILMLPGQIARGLQLHRHRWPQSAV